MYIPEHFKETNSVTTQYPLVRHSREGRNPVRRANCP